MTPSTQDSQSSGSSSDQVTLMVFKDNFSARTFQIPFTWISKFGLLLGALFGITFLSTFFAVKYYSVSRRADLDRLQDLEQEIIDLRARATTAEAAAKSATITAATQVQVTAPAVNAPAQSTATAPLPVPTVTVTVTATPEPVANATPAAPVTMPPIVPAGSQLFFTAMPSTIHLKPVAPEALPLTMQSPRAQWRGKTLGVRLALQYNKQDGGNQQGRILIFARGPESLLAYPAGVMTKIGSGSLFAPEKGEFFSVSRYREVRAEFGPMKSNDSLTEVEVLILGPENQILIYEKLAPQRKAASPKVESSTEAPAQPDPEATSEPTN